MNISNIQIFQAAVLAFFVGGTAGYLGSLMLTKRMSLVGGALGHLALPGVSLALLYDFDVGWGALLFLALGVSIIWLLEKRTHLALDVLTGVVFSTALALSFLILPKEEMNIALLGNVSDISLKIVFIGCLASVFILLLAHSIVNSIVLTVISEDLARASKINVSRDNLLYLFCIGLTVALGVRIIGGLMTAALVTIPAATSANMCSTFKRYLIMSILIGSVSSAMGVLLSFYTGGPVGVLIILMSALFFLLSLFCVHR